MATGIPATTSIADWNRATKHVESAVRSGRYVNAETALVFAGPPRISDIGSLNNGDTFAAGGGAASNAVFGASGQDALYPIGLVEQFGLQQAQNVQKMFEIGSRRSYQAGGRVQVVGNLGRVMFNGPSLLRVLYAYYPNTIQMANGNRIGPAGDQDSVSREISGSGDAATQVFPQIYFEPGSKAGLDPEGGEQAAPHSFFINLMSELFSHPFGIGVILRDNRNRNFGAMFLEDCMITAHSWNINSTSTLVTEAVNFQADAAVPMEFSTLNGTDGAGDQIAPLAQT
jgi:hypothetical protein